MTSKTNEVDGKGSFKRQQNYFTRNFGEEKNDLLVIDNKYRLIWSPVCPWAHRSVIVRKLLGLETVISLGTLDPIRPKTEKIDWAFTLDPENQDPVLEITYLSEAYLKADSTYEGRPTVPAIVDIETGKVVNNDYHELTYQLETAWEKYHKVGAPDLFPKELQEEIRELNTETFNHINNGVYKAGFARSQESYEAAYDEVFNQLDIYEKRLEKQRYLFGNQLTDADVRLFVTLVRFDVAYYSAFKVNKKRIADYPNLWAYARDLYQTPGFGDTTDFEAIKKHYFLSATIDPKKSHSKLLPKGPDLSGWQTAHHRETLG